MKVRPFRSLVIFATALALLAGCRMSVPIHVWQPPQLASVVGKRVAVSPIVGPPQIAEPLHEAVIGGAPSDAGRQLTLVDARQLQDETQIQLVSSTDHEPNDVALAAVARREGFDYLLRGEVLSEPPRSQRRSTSRAPARSQNAPPDQDASLLSGRERLILSWRLTPLVANQEGGGKPLVVDPEAIAERYPDLNSVADRRQSLVTAAARDTYRLFAPSVSRQRVQLDIAYLMPGSKKLRRGNAAALAGRWAEAARCWREVAEAHPSQVAAIHNLAVAAAAAQDFSRAKRLARQAVRLQPSSHHQRTLVWIELRQRDYHAAFGLPAPPEGWFVTRGPQASGETGPRAAGKSPQAASGSLLSAGSDAQLDQPAGAVAD